MTHRRKINAYEYVGLPVDISDQGVIACYLHCLTHFDANKHESLAQLAAFILIYEHRRLPESAGSPLIFAMHHLNDNQFAMVYNVLGRPVPARPSAEWVDSHTMPWQPWVNPPLLVVAPRYQAAAPDAVQKAALPPPPQVPDAPSEVDFSGGKITAPQRSRGGWVLPAIGLAASAGVVASALWAGGGKPEKGEPPAPTKNNKTGPPEKPEPNFKEIEKAKAELQTIRNSIRIYGEKGLRELLLFHDDQYGTQWVPVFAEVITLASKANYEEAAKKLAIIPTHPDLTDDQKEKLGALLEKKNNGDPLIQALHNLAGKRVEKQPAAFTAGDYAQHWEKGLERLKELLRQAQKPQEILKNANAPVSDPKSR